MYTFTITTQQAGRKLASILQSDWKMSRRLLRQLIQVDGVRKNDDVTYLSARVAAGDEISVALPAETSLVTPYPIPIDICYEDGEIIVVNKPKRLLTHPTARERAESMLGAVAAYLQSSHLVPHSVHRLDRDTTGVVMFAKHAHTHHLFDIALQQGHMHRSYVALVYIGNPEALAGDDRWRTVDKPIALHPTQPSRRVISEDGQRAVTHYGVLATSGRVAAILLRLETGRTHQIRLHMASVGLPLLGDRDYTMAIANLPAPPDAVSYVRLLDRQALHAHRLEWQHPVTGENGFAVATVANDMRELWIELGGAPDVLDEDSLAAASLRLAGTVC